MTHDEPSSDWLMDDEPWSAELREALRIADRQDGTAEQVARLEAKLAPLLKGSAMPHAAPESGATGISSSAIKALTAAVALVGVGALMWPQREHAQRPPASESSSERAHLERQASAEAAPYVVLAPESAGEEASATEGQEPLAKERASAERASAQRTPGTAATLALEARLLKRARSALGKNPAEALRLSDQHRLRFAQGALVEEREAIAIKALRELGQHATADARQARFETRFPQSPHLASLRSQAKSARD